MKITPYHTVGETLVTHTTANGLRVLMVPKPTYHETHALLSVNYGANDTHYLPAGASDPVVDPDGIAHFLEHKLFEKEDHDAFERFGETGANANAYTSATRTTYLFTTTKALMTNLAILLDFVQTPYFSEQTVEKEKGIIGQEIQMYQDDAGWRLFFGIIGNLYPHHPVSVDVAGTVASIEKITPEMLYRVHQTFYQPTNMTLTLVGNFEPDEVVAELERLEAAGPTPNNQPRPTTVEFDGDVASILPYRMLKLPIVRPKSIVGIKGQVPVRDDEAGLKVQISIRLLLEMIFGDSGPLYQQWYDSGLIDDSFDFDYASQDTYNYATIGGDATDPTALSEAIAAVIAQGADQDCLTEARFEQVKHAALGKYYQSLNSLGSIAAQVSAQSFSPVPVFEYGALMNQLTLADLQQAAAEFFDMAALSVFHVLPEDEQ